LASLAREKGPKLVKGTAIAPAPPQKHHQHHLPAASAFANSDSSLKFTHVLYNLSPAGTCPFLLFTCSGKQERDRGETDY
jgi:phosphoenolpyruvate carboxykinase (ATP)